MERITIADNESYLRQISSDVDLGDKSYFDDIKALEEYCLGNKVFAMAAVQVGIPKRIIYLKNTTLDSENFDDISYNEGQILINPVIKNRKGHTRFWEACASCLDNMGLVSRPYVITIAYQDIDGNLQIRTLEGFEATVFSHEYDHLNGILHIDIAREIKKMPQSERIKFRESHPYEIISKDCNFEEIENKMRKGKDIN